LFRVVIPIGGDRLATFDVEPELFAGRTAGGESWSIRMSMPVAQSVSRHQVPYCSGVRYTKPMRRASSSRKNGEMVTTLPGLAVWQASAAVFQTARQ
jgi:hypothetical protein